MSVNAIIKGALDYFKDPVEFNIYTGAADKYYVFNYNTFGADFANDDPQHERILIQVHFFCPRSFNSLSRIRDTKKRLLAAGFTWPDVVNASDEDSQHYVFECEYTEGVDLDV